ncbi:ANFC4 protein, partial [Atractosteus spatula]|uniref:Natriuretic peptide C n=2 Tax=Lepisosteidae TaxID=7915 RepID=W5MBM5_LEPOC|nr:PREDICTED: C-type natriuretic peptide [Lepisosteus oculatus]MBN3321433.1 ANFC4 protein [Atractosteus spatula]
MNISHLVACGLLMTLLSVSMEAKPLTPAQQKSLRSLLGEELSEYLASGETEGKLESARSRVRLLRDLRLDTRAKAAWARILNDQPSPRKFKGGVKKGGSRGCFGHKIDRIGTISGLGC